MKILLIGASKNPNTVAVGAYYQQYVDFFKRSAASTSRDCVIETCLFDDLIISVGDGKFNIYNSHNKQQLSEYDVFILRGDDFRRQMDIIGTINEYANLNNIISINRHDGVRDSSKLLQAVHFHMLGIPVARTLLLNSVTLDGINELDWSFPCIMKAVHGSHGNDNYVVHDVAEVRSIVERQANKRFVLQRLIPNKGDYRILIIGDDAIVIGRTAVEGSHLNNTSQGGEAVLIENSQLSDVVLDNAKRIMKYYGMTIAGVDVLADESTGEYFFLEVNSQPQLMSGAFVAEKEKLIGALFDKLSNQR